MTKQLDNGVKLDDVIVAEIGDDGKVYLTIDASVVVRIRGDESRVVEGTSMLVSNEDIIELSGRHHHTNPAGARFYDARMKRVNDDPSVRQLMIDREISYRAMDRIRARRSFYLEAARRNINSRKKGSRCKSCTNN